MNAQNSANGFYIQGGATVVAGGFRRLVLLVWTNLSRSRIVVVVEAQLKYIYFL